MKDIREELGLPPDATGTELVLGIPETGELPPLMQVSIVPQPEGEGPPIGAQWPVDEVLRAAREQRLIGVWQQLGEDEHATRIR